MFHPAHEVTFNELQKYFHKANGDSSLCVLPSGWFVLNFIVAMKKKKWERTKERKNERRVVES